ncbi:LLM class flavin-dependent oxidoreductase [Enterococcus alcedinis]|uniref:Luciferase n=1 Tax=Enterococcus alcedinis TaxID=1274384 RepID=A0A917JGT6_9ENTE|nr:LLM class flavin-dependent oxidoreductase [Enterococcus alcedinis]MBP2101987.1 alkanesulfonate monooxygenase SsuD/methylene tetrahydromethanopterin reductase-like flavin-dependent oxidoreductase (luciferase family) [Enterococcus alcedinis]GGI65550.1 luciferase [Enterococcus alcedinis]
MTKENLNFIPKFDASKGLEFGIYTLGDHIKNPHTGEPISPQTRLNNIKEMAILSEQAGLDTFIVGESHQDHFVTQAHAIVLAMIAEATEKIKISSGATIVSTSDPVRIFENFATIDLMSNGRIELVGGRASRVGLFELLGYDLADYEELFEEKFDLLLKLNQSEYVDWEGKFRAPLRNAHVLPRPLNKQLPIWRAVGGGPGSAVRAGRAGVPMYMAHLAGAAQSFKYTIDTYRQSAAEAGYDAASLPIATAGLFYVADTTQEAMREFYPHVDQGIRLTNGQGFPKQAFVHAQDPRSILNVGSPQEIIEKILYQHELFGHQRYIAQLDFGGVPFDKIMKNIELIGNDILPAIKKYTAK